MRSKGFTVVCARDLGLSPRDDRFHLQEARRRHVILLTNDRDFLDQRRFPFSDLKDTAVVVLRTPTSPCGTSLSYALISLLELVARSGRRDLVGLKVEIDGPKVTLHKRVRGRVTSETFDISQR